MDEGARPSPEGNAHESGDRKVKGTSNMFMFKIRAFEDALKLRGKHPSVLQPRCFNYLPKTNNENDLSEKKLRLRQSATAEKPAQSNTDYDEHIVELYHDELRRKYDDARQLCQDQLTVLQETKSLLLRETERNCQLQSSLTQLKAASRQQLEELESVRNTLLAKEGENNELRVLLQETGVKCRSQSKRRMQLQQQVKELREESAAAEADIRSIRESMQFYQKELVKVAGDNNEQNNDINRRLQEVQNRSLELESEKRQLQERLSELQAAFLREAEAHKLEMSDMEREHSRQLAVIREQAHDQLAQVRLELLKLETRQDTADAATTTDDAVPPQCIECSMNTDNGFQQQLARIEEDRAMLSHELQLMKSIVERQKQILHERDQQHLLQTAHYETLVAARASELEQERQKVVMLESLVNCSRSSILESLEHSRHQSEKQKLMFESVLAENLALKKKLAELKEQLRNTH